MVLIALGGSDCEALRSGLLGQPVNSLSSLAYVAAGAWLLRRGGRPGPALALAAVGLGSVLYHGPMPPGARLIHDGSLLAVPATALSGVWRHRSFPRPPALAVVALVAGAVANLLTRTGAPLCRPDSLAQGHALWHVLTAVGAAAWLDRWRDPLGLMWKGRGSRAGAPWRTTGGGPQHAGSADDRRPPRPGIPRLPRPRRHRRRARPARRLVG